MSWGDCLIVPLSRSKHNVLLCSRHFKTFFPAFNFFKNLFIYFWLCCVFVCVRGLSLVAASGATLHRGARASHCRGLSCCGAQAPDAQAQ